MVIDTLFTIDTVVLSWFAFEQLQDISNYTIALKFTSLFFLIPMQLHRSLQIVLANYNEPTKQANSINAFIKVNFVVSFAQLLFVFVGGNWLIHVLFGEDIPMDVTNYTIIIALGVTLMNMSWPLMSIINNFCSLRQAFFWIFLPALAFGFSVYVWTAITWGAIGVAYGNIVIYTALALGLVIFTAKHYPFPLKLGIITEQERGVLHDIFRGNS